MLKPGESVSQKVDGATIKVERQANGTYRVTQNGDRVMVSPSRSPEAFGVGGHAFEMGTLTPAEKLNWLIWLTAGVLMQGIAVLCTIDEEGNEAYCCLGVKAEAEGAPMTERLETNGVSKSRQRNYRAPHETRGNSSVLTPGLRRGMTMEGQDFLTYLNDGGYTFPQIGFVIDVIW